MTLAAGQSFVYEGLDLLGTFAVAGDLKEWSETQLAGKPFAFERLCDQVRDLGYDFLIFDLGPGISILEKSVLAYIDEVVPVVAAEYFSADGVQISTSPLTEWRSSSTSSRSSAKTGRRSLSQSGWSSTE